MLAPTPPALETVSVARASSADSCRRSGSRDDAEVLVCTHKGVVVGHVALDDLVHQRSTLVTDEEKERRTILDDGRVGSGRGGAPWLRGMLRE